MRDMTVVEFYRKGSDKFLARLSGDLSVPREGEFVSIRQVTYRVHRVTWAVDYLEKAVGRELRACVDLVEEGE